MQLHCRYRDHLIKSKCCSFNSLFYFFRPPQDPKGDEAAEQLMTNDKEKANDAEAVV